MLPPGRFISLRGKLVLSGLGVQLLVAAFLLSAHLRATDQILGKEIAARIEHSAPLLRAALIDPLLQRDYATLATILAETHNPDDFKYFILVGPRGDIVATSPRPPRMPLPPVDATPTQPDWQRADRCVHLSLEIKHAGQYLGTLRYALSLAPSDAHRSALLGQGLVIGAIGALLGTLAFALIGMGLTRGLRQLARGSDSIRQGEYHVRLNVESNDEFGGLAQAFNDMSQAIEARIADLLQSHAKQNEYLDAARAERARLSALLGAMRFGVLLVDNDERIRYANPAFSELFVVAPEWLAGNPPLRGLATVSGLLVSLGDAPPEGLLRKPGEAFGAVLTELQISVDRYWRQVSRPVIDERGEAIGRLWMFEDVSDERQARQLINRLAERDSLTGLLNRHTFGSILEAMTAGRHVEPIALYFVDLDNFKMINDLNGHAVGDRMLAKVAGALSLTFRPEDIVARLGGDEFAIAVKGLSREQAPALCERLLRNVAQASGSAMALSASPVKIGCSIGIAWYPEDAQQADELIAAADQAMYAAKEEGRNTWRSYAPRLAQTREKAEWLVWTERLNDALARGSFEIYLQGIYTIRDRALDHYEALVRLADPESPGEYYPLHEFIVHAEDSGKILALDRWMLERCIARLAEDGSHPPIAVNISARTLIDPDLVEYIARLLDSAQVHPERLHLELTETSALTNIEQAGKAVQRLREIGCKCSLDDFGSGFTSLAYLKQLRTDYIKIDGAFIKDVARDLESRILLRAIVDIAHATQRKVVAEWIEDEATLDMVLDYGIDLAQGFLLGKPYAMPLPSGGQVTP